MVIQHNISALNAHRYMGINNAGTASNLEKLSSGYKINRAGDDAAGLAISEKMRGQIRGLGMAEQNTENAVSLIQTAEGGLNETHSILQRMRELAVQASNGTYQDEDRIQITKEYEALKSEIDRIAESTHYNNIKLLDGSLGGKSSSTASNISMDTILNMKLAAGGGVDAYADVFAKIAGTAEEYITGGTSKLVDATKAAAATDLAVRDITVEYVDEQGNAQKVEVRIDNLDATGAASTWVVGALDEMVDALNKTDLAKYFTITQTAGELSFESLKTGDEGAAHITGIKVERLVDSATTLTGTVAEKREALYALADSQKGKVAETVVTQDATASTAFDNETLTVDLAELDPTDQNKNWFELDGHKFILTSDANEAFKTGATDGNGATYLNIKDITAVTGGEQAQIKAVIEEKLGLAASVDGVGLITIEAKSSDSPNAGTTSGTALIFQIGANGGADQRVSLSINAMDSKNLGITSADVAYTKVTGATLAQSSIDDRDLANAAIDIISGASDMVSTQRAELGALQNRLEHTLNSLGTTKENLTAAESSIRDTDMAKEMMEFTKNNILVQAAQAMLAQANQLPQGVLQLLR